MALVVSKSNITCPVSSSSISGARNGGSAYLKVTRSSNSQTAYVGLRPSSDGYSDVSLITNVRFNAIMWVANDTGNGTITGSSSSLSCTPMLGDVSTTNTLFNFSGNDISFTSASAVGSTKSASGANYNTSDIAVTESAVSGSVAVRDVVLGARLVFASSYGLSHTTRVYVKNPRFSYDIKVRNRVTFKGEGIAETTNIYNHGDIPSFSGTTSKTGYYITGWVSSADNQTYTDLPACNGHDVTYTAKLAKARYSVSISSRMVDLNATRDDTVIVDTPVAIDVCIKDSSGNQLPNNTNVEYETSVKLNALTSFERDEYTLVLDHFEVVVDGTTTVLGIIGSSAHYNEDRSQLYISYNIGDGGCGNTTVLAVYQRIYTVQILATNGITVHTQYDATERSVFNTWVSYYRNATQMATTAGIITMTATNLFGYGLRDNGDGSTIPNNVTLNTSSTLKDRVTTWTIAPGGAPTTIIFECYSLTHSVIVSIDDMNVINRVEILRNNSPIVLDNFVLTNRTYETSLLVDDGDEITYVEHQDGSSKYATQTHIISDMTPTNDVRNYDSISTFNDVRHDIRINITSEVVWCSISANQPENGTVTVTPSTQIRTGVIHIELEYDDDMMLVGLYDTINGKSYSLIDIVTGVDRVFSVNGQVETISYHDNIIIIDNIQQDHQFRIELDYDLSKWLYVYTIGAYVPGVQICAYDQTPNNIIASCNLPAGGDASIRRDIYDGYQLLMTLPTQYELVGCALTLYSDTVDGIAVDEWSQTVFTPSVGVLNSMLRQLLTSIIPGDGLAYSLCIEPVFRLNEVYLSYTSNHSGEPRTQHIWYIDKNGVERVPVKSVWVMTRNRQRKQVYGIVDTQNDDAWTEQYTQYLQSIL